MIKEVYGIDVPELGYVSREYANWLDDYGFIAIRYLSTAYELKQYIESEGIDNLSQEQLENLLKLEESNKKREVVIKALEKKLKN